MPTVTAVPVTTTSDTGKQLSDQNSLGTYLGASTSDKIAFYSNTGAIVQPASQGSLKNAFGVVTTYAVTTTPVSVAANTAAEQTVTVTGVATGQLVIVTKPTAQAGLAVASSRVSATNTVAITFANDTAAAITPTAGETYIYTAIPASMLLTATLSPVAVQPNTTTEQQFTVAGLPLASAVVVNKPTAQAGLAILNARAVSAGVLGITFANLTAATITPTASESYLVYAAGEVQIAPVMRALTATLTPASVAANTTVEQTFTVSNIPSTAQVFVNKPSLQVGLSIGGARVSATNTIAITYVNNTAAAITPASETYTIGLFPNAVPAAGSSTSYNGQFGGPGLDHQALTALGLVGAP